MHGIKHETLSSPPPTLLPWAIGSQLFYVSNLRHGLYNYTTNLLALEGEGGSAAVSNPGLQLIATPLKAAVQERELATYPDRIFASFLLRCFCEGFHIGIRIIQFQMLPFSP